MATGIIKLFNEAKKFGFIARDDGEGDLFFHITGVTDKSVDVFEVGSRVEFAIGVSAKNGRPIAEKISVLA